MPDPDANKAVTERSGAPLDQPTRRVAIALLIIFVVAVAVMFWLRGDPHWDRLVYVFGGLEAIVFAGAGALFGTTVQRSTVAAARADTQQARNDAAQAQNQAKASAEAAANGKALAAAVKAVGSVPPSAAEPPEREEDDLRRAGRPEPVTAEGADGQPGPSRQAPNTTVQALARMADELFPN